MALGMRLSPREDRQQRRAAFTVLVKLSSEELEKRRKDAGLLPPSPSPRRKGCPAGPSPQPALASRSGPSSILLPSEEPEGLSSPRFHGETEGQRMRVGASPVKGRLKPTKTNRRRKDHEKTVGLPAVSPRSPRVNATGSLLSAAVGSLPVVLPPPPSQAVLSDPLLSGPAPEAGDLMSEPQTGAVGPANPLKRLSLGNFQRALTGAKAEVQEQRQVKRADLLEQQRHQFELGRVLKHDAVAKWRNGEFDECRQKLDQAIEINQHSDVLRSFRSRAYLKACMVPEAIVDAEVAVQLSPRAENHRHLAICLQQKERFVEAGSEYMKAGTDETPSRDYVGLLGQIRRKRGFFNGRVGRRERIMDDGSAADTAAVLGPELFVRAEAPFSGPSRLHVSWVPTENDDPSSIVEYTLQYARRRVVFEPKSTSFEERYDAWKALKLRLCSSDLSAWRREGCPKESALQLDRQGLLYTRIDEDILSGAAYKLRAVTFNDDVTSLWGPEVVALTMAGEGDTGNHSKAAPLSWLFGIMSLNLAVDEAAKDSGGPRCFIEAVAAAANRHVVGLRRAFSLYASKQHLISRLEFLRFMKDLGLLKGSSPANAQVPRQMPPTDFDLLCQRLVRSISLESASAAAQGGAVISPRQRGSTGDQAKTNELLRLTAEFHGETVGAAEAEMEDSWEGDAATGMMARFEWVAGLTEVAAYCYMRQPTLAERLDALCTDVLAYTEPLVAAMRRKRAALHSEEVAALFLHFDKDLRKIFKSYAAANQNAAVQDSSTRDSVDLAELQFMMQEGGMIDEHLTKFKLAQIFAEANAGAEEEGVNDDAVELVFEEFLMALGLICDAKIPEENRSGEPFHYTLHAWLVLQFLPKYRTLLKDKDRGIGRKSLN